MDWLARLAIGHHDIGAALRAQHYTDIVSIAQLAADVVCMVHEPDGNIRWISESVQSYTGWTADELRDRSWQSVIHPIEYERIGRTWQESNGDPLRVQHRMRMRNGGYRWFNTTIQRLPGNEQPGHLLLSLHDVDEQVRLAQRSHWSEVALRGLFDGIPDPITVWRPIRDQRGTITDLKAVKTNRAFDASTGGYSMEGRLASAAAPETLRLIPRIMDVLSTGTACTLQVQHRGRRLHLHLSPMSNRDVVITSRDVSELQPLGAAADREEANHLARVAHTLRTNLTVVQGWIEMLEDEQCTTDPELSRAAIESIARNTKNLIATVNTLMEATAPSGNYQLATRAMDLAQRLRTMTDDLRASHRHLRFTTDVPESLIAFGNADAVDIAVRHLLENAARFATSAVTLRARNTGALVEIDVMDDGPGIAVDVELFKPFTPNHHGNGHGVGLNVVRKIAEALDGSVHGRNREDGPGACFTLTLPAVWADQTESSNR